MYYININVLYDIYVNEHEYVKKRNYFVFIIYKLNKGVERVFLEGVLLKLMPNILRMVH